MAVRLHSELTDRYNDTWKVEIIDHEYEGDSSAFQLAEVELERASKGIERHDPICGSATHVTMLYNNEVVREFLDLLIDTQNPHYVDDNGTIEVLRFYMKVYKNESFFWLGTLLPNQTVLPDNLNSYATLIAVDGLKALTERKYAAWDNEGGTSGRDDRLDKLFPFTGKRTFLEIISDDILTKTYLRNQFQEEEPFIRTSLNIKETQMFTEPDIELEVLEKIRVERGAFKSGENSPVTAYEVLRQILLAMNSRIYFEEGVFKIVQLSNYLSGSYFFNEFDKNGLRLRTYVEKEHSVTIGNTLNNDYKKESGSTFMHLRPVYKYQIKQYNAGISNMLPEQDSYEIPINLYDGIEAFNNNSILKLQFTLEQKVTENNNLPIPVGGVPYSFNYQVNLRVGSYYLSNFKFTNKSGNLTITNPGTQPNKITANPGVSIASISVGDEVKFTFGNSGWEDIRIVTNVQFGPTVDVITVDEDFSSPTANSGIASWAIRKDDGPDKNNDKGNLYWSKKTDSYFMASTSVYRYLPKTSLYQLSIETPPLKENGTSSNSIFSLTVLDYGQTLNGVIPYLSYKILDSSIYYLRDGKEPNESIKYVGYNPNTQAGLTVKNHQAIEMDLGEVLFGDTTNPNVLGQLEVQKPTNDWAPSVLWVNKWLGDESRPLLKKVIELLKKGQNRTLRRLETELLSNSILYDQSISYDGRTWIPEGWNIFLSIGKCQAQFVEVISEGDVDLRDDILTPTDGRIEDSLLGSLFSLFGRLSGKVDLLNQAGGITYTDEDLEVGNQSSVEIIPIGQNEILDSGDTIQLISKMTGETVTLVLSVAVSDVDTSISFTETFIPSSFETGSVIMLSQLSLIQKLSA